MFFIVRLIVLNLKIVDRLDNINWNFGTRLVIDDNEIFPFNNRKYHSYPATFIPEIPFSLIEILSSEGDVVLDPFGGIGTTFVQALIQKRVPVSIDNNSVASEITQDFFTLFNPRIDLLKALEAIRDRLQAYDEKTDYSLRLYDMNSDLIDWYEGITLNQIAFLMEEYDYYCNTDTEYGTREIFHLCFSNLLTYASSQNGGWAYIADNVKPKKCELIAKPAIERFLINATACVNNIQSYKEKLGDSILYLYNDSFIKHVMCDDFSKMDFSNMHGKVDLVITSPPYPRMIDYVKSQRLTFYMIGKDFKSELATEIGARARRNQKNTIESYIKSMKKCNEQILNSLKQGGYLCYILPDFSLERKKDRKMAIDEVLNDCIDRGMEVVYETGRYIPGTQRSNNIKWASLKREQIVILEKK